MCKRLSSTLPTSTTTMGVYKLSIQDLDPKSSSKSSPPFFKSSFLRGTATTFMGRRFSTKVQPTLRSFLEAPDIEPPTLPTDPISSSEDDNSCSSSLFTASSTRTPSHFLTSDDDACLRELSNSLRGGGFDNSGFASLARHSTACCTDGALRQELRRKFHLEDTSSTRSRNSFAMGRCSFRRELDTTEDRVENLALWEETSESSLSTSAKERVVRNDWTTAHSWPHGQATSPSVGYSGKLGLESLFRKPKKATSSFFSGFFSGLSFSSSRRSRKSKY